MSIKIEQKLFGFVQIIYFYYFDKDKKGYLNIENKVYSLRKALNICEEFHQKIAANREKLLISEFEYFANNKSCNSVLILIYFLVN